MGSPRLSSTVTVNQEKLTEPMSIRTGGETEEQRALRYQMWTLRQMPTRDDLFRQRLSSKRLAYKPTISIVTPLFNTAPDALRRMLTTVRDQTYPFWQLCLVDDGSTERWIAPRIERETRSDARLVFHRRLENGGIVAASNDALELTTGEYVAFLDHDDELDPQALYAIARLLNDRPDVDMIYSDLDVIGSNGMREGPSYWPDWSPELLTALPYTAHFRVIRRQLISVVGGIRDGFDGAQDYDLALRISERTQNVAHIPRVLYHWRASPQSVAGNPDAKPYVYEAGQRAVAEYVSRNFVDARRTDGFVRGFHRIQLAPAIRPRVSVVLITERFFGLGDPGTPSSLGESLTSLLNRTEYPNFEIIVVIPNGSDTSNLASIRTAARVPLQFCVYHGEPDEGLLANAGVGCAEGDVLVFLDGLIRPLTADWLSSMLDFAQQDGIGAVGAKVYAPDGTIAHSGIVVPRAVPHPSRWGQEDWGEPLGLNLHVPWNYSAVSLACLMTRRSVFDALAGFRSVNEVGFDDVDYGLRMRELKLRSVVTPYARLQYCDTPMRSTRRLGSGDRPRLVAFQRVWASKTEVDPYYNPNFYQDDGQYSLIPDLPPTSELLVR